MTLTEMAALVVTGDALRLFTDDPVGPVHYAGVWWVVSEARSRFAKVTDLAVVRRLGQQVARLRAAGVAAVGSL